MQKAAGLKVPPAKCKGWPGTKLGRCEVVFPSGPVPLVVRFTGNPVRAMKILLICQLPKTAFMKPGWERYLLPTPKGSS